MGCANGGQRASFFLRLWLSRAIRCQGVLRARGKVNSWLGQRSKHSDSDMTAAPISSLITGAQKWPELYHRPCVETQRQVRMRGGRRASFLLHRLLSKAHCAGLVLSPGLLQRLAGVLHGSRVPGQEAEPEGVHQRRRPRWPCSGGVAIPSPPCATSPRLLPRRPAWEPRDSRWRRLLRQTRVRLLSVRPGSPPASRHGQARRCGRVQTPGSRHGRLQLKPFRLIFLPLMRCFLVGILAPVGRVQQIQPLFLLLVRHALQYCRARVARKPWRVWGASGDAEFGFKKPESPRGTWTKKSTPAVDFLRGR